eukprot:3221590-Prymnesium_polylepis.1
MAVKPGIDWEWDQLRLEVDVGSRFAAWRHAAAPPDGLTVHLVSLAQLHRWPIRPSWSTLSWP